MANIITGVATATNTTYPVQMRLVGTTVFVAGVKDSSGNYVCTLNNVPAGTYGPGTVEYQLTGSNPLVSAFNTNTVTVTGVTAAPTILAPPTGLAATPTSASTIGLSWNAVANASSYLVQRATDSAFTANVTTVYAGTGTSTIDSGLTASTLYYYRILAAGTGAYSNSPYSTSVSATTAAAPVTATYTPQTADYGLLAMNRTDSAGNVQRSYGSTLDFTSNQNALTLLLLNTEAAGNAQPSGITVLQAGQAPQVIRPTGGTAASNYPVTLLGSAPYNGRIVLGTLERAGEMGAVLGRVVQQLTFATGSTSSLVAPTKKSECYIFITDSIGTGTGTPTPETDGWLPKLRALDTTRDYLNNGYQSRQLRVALADSAAITLLNNELATASAGYTTVTFVLCLGTNDYSQTPSMLAGLISNWLTATRTQFPSATLIVASPIVANSAYASEANMPAIRSAMAGTITNQPNMRYVDGLTLLSDNTQLNTDGVHPLSAGHTTIANNWASVIMPGAYQAETTAYLARLATAGGVLTTPQKDALNTFINTMKAQGLYARMQEFWPICGGVAASHALGFKNFANLTWKGSITHSATGALGDGSSGYGDTGINPSTVGGLVGLNDTHISYYSRQNRGSTAGEREMGVADEVSGASILRIMTNIQNSTRMEVNSAGDSHLPVTSTAGFFLASRQASGSMVAYQNAAAAFNSTASSSSLPNGPVAIMAQASLTGTIAGYSTKECAFASIGGGLSPAQVNIMYGALQTLQTALGRNV